MINSAVGRQAVLENRSAGVSNFSGVGSSVRHHEKTGFVSGREAQNTAAATGKHSKANERHALEQLMSELNAVMLNLSRVLVKSGSSVDKLKSDKLPKLPKAPERVNSGVQAVLSGKKLFALSGKTPGVRPQDVWFGVRFSTQNNEGTLSSIKAAMMRFGQSPLGVFSSVTPSGDGYDIVMRDGFKLRLTLKEIAQARFNGYQPGYTVEDGGMRKDVSFMYAAVAKRVQLENQDGSVKDFKGAIGKMQSDQSPGACLKRLGLSGHMRRTTWESLGTNGGIGVVAAGRNTNFAFEGLLDGCNIKHGLPRGHTGEAYEVI